MNFWHLMCFLLAFFIGKSIKNYDRNNLLKNISDLKNKISDLKTNEDVLKLKAFRVGDLVYTDRDKFKFNKPYYVIGFYNNGYYARIHPEKDYKGNLFEGIWGVAVSDLQHNQFPKCKTCGKDY